MKLLKPKNYRLKQGQDAWLRRQALKQGHGNVNLALRLLIDEVRHGVTRRAG